MRYFQDTIRCSLCGFYPLSKMLLKTVVAGTLSDTPSLSTPPCFRPAFPTGPSPQTPFGVATHGWPLQICKCVMSPHAISVPFFKQPSVGRCELGFGSTLAAYGRDARSAVHKYEILQLHNRTSFLNCTIEMALQKVHCTTHCRAVWC